MTSVAVQFPSSTNSTQAPQRPRLVVYLTDSESEASEDSSCQVVDNPSERLRIQERWRLAQAGKRRKVSKQLYQPVYIEVEPERQKKTYSVDTQWKPFPKDCSFVKWRVPVKKLELRRKHIDIYETKWQRLEFDDIFEDSQWDHPKFQFVEQFNDPSIGADSIVNILFEEHRRDRSGRVCIPDYIESTRFTEDSCSSDLESSLDESESDTEL